MVEEQLRRRGVADDRVLAAMEKVPRHLFVPAAQAAHAYEDGPLPIGAGQTISQPYMVARMTELLSLDRDSRVLEIGTGSGYQAAVLAELASQVWTVERLPDLAARAKALLARQGYANVTVITADGSQGYPSSAPYDAILVAAAAPQVPPSLRDQLTIGGRMVIPREAGAAQELLLIERLADTQSGADDAGTQEKAFRETAVLNCVFVPLVGAEGYEE
jgi:protein-L-isoaspartate(D-aspartate) O-methyltransferase